MMDASGNVVNSYTYDQFGAILEQTEGTYNPFKYAGELHDMPDNLIYLRNRIYDPKIGRFLTEDPIKDGTNWYVYCNNNPVNYWDPLGLYSLEIDESGQVYAIIESGDTLSAISKSEVNDASAWTKMSYTGDPTKLQVGDKVNVTDIYNEAHPNPNINYAEVPPPSSGYEAPKKGPKWNKEKGGWEDKYGNVWVKDKSGHGGKHWDVQYPGGGYDNVYDDGHVRPGSGNRGRFSPATNISVDTSSPTPNNSNKTMINDNVVKVGGAVFGGVIVYQAVKWGIAIAASVPSSGVSIGIAAATP